MIDTPTRAKNGWHMGLEGTFTVNGQDARARCDVHLESAHHIAGDVAVWAVAAHSQRALMVSRWSRIAADDEHDARAAALRAAWEKIVGG